MQEHAIRQLAAAVVLQAVTDYFNAPKARRPEILKDLRSPWMEGLTNGTSAIVAERLEKRPKEVRARFRKYEGGSK